MLAHQQILHFRTFGYVTLPGLLSLGEAVTLRQEVAGALTDAFGRLSTEPNDLGGISGDYLPLAVNRAPLSLALIADDPRTFGSSAELLGGPTVPSVGIATCFTGDSTWHTRLGPDLDGVTFWVDLEPCTAETGALRLILGSHLPEFERRLWQYCRAEPAVSGFEPWEWPGLGDPGRLAVVRAMTEDDVEFDHEDYDRDRFPVWREWASGAAQVPSRAIAVERLKLLGVLDNLGDGRPPVIGDHGGMA